MLREIEALPYFVDLSCRTYGALSDLDVHMGDKLQAAAETYWRSGQPLKRQDERCAPDLGDGGWPAGGSSCGQWTESGCFPPTFRGCEENLCEGSGLRAAALPVAPSQQEELRNSKIVHEW